MVELLFPRDKANISLMTDVQKEFERRHREGKCSDEWITTEMAIGRELSDPAVVLFKWKSDDPTVPLKFKLSTDPEFKSSIYDGAIGSLHSIFHSAEELGVYYAWVDNLLVDTEYFWKVDDGSEICNIRSFTTLPGEIRRIRSASYGNIRDIGGKYNENGKYVKQGMIFRGTLLERDGFIPSSLPDETHRIMYDDMKIHTEIDLRGEGMTFDEFKNLDKSISCLDKDVNYCYIPLGSYESIFKNSEHEALRKIFDVFADEKNYPIYFHCVAGADRTGTLAVLLESVLDFTIDDIVLDYNATTLNPRFGSRDWYDVNERSRPFINELENRYPNKTLQKACKEFLKSIGITEERFEKIRNIILK